MDEETKHEMIYALTTIDETTYRHDKANVALQCSIGLQFCQLPFACNSNTKRSIDWYITPTSYYDTLFRWRSHLLAKSKLSGEETIINLPTLPLPQ